MPLSRRALLGGAASLAALGATRAAPSVPWATPPDRVARSVLRPPEQRVQQLLEVYLYGGLGPFETFYTVPGYGAPDDPRYPSEQSWLYRSQVEAARERCGHADLPFSEPFARDALGVEVHLGPFVAALRRRPDILARMRVLVMHHTLEPHEAAIPYALTGFRLGNSRLAGLGASVQRYFLDREPGDRRVPWAWVLYPEDIISTDNVRAASAVGLHTGAARPLDLRIGQGGTLHRDLARPWLHGRAEAWDALVAHQGQALRGRYQLADGPQRSRALDDHAYAARTLAEGDALAQVLGTAGFTPIPTTSCDTDRDTSLTEMSLELATSLLTHPTAPARHITVVDGGMIPASGGGGYDVHTDHVRDTARNLHATLEALAWRINEPGEANPSKIDLDQTMIVLNTEFGRTPFAQPGPGAGTNHHPYGYVTVLIGGAVGPEQRGIVGAIGPDGWAADHVTPVEARAALLTAMGIWPFTQESFAIGDLRELRREADGVVWLDEIVLGRRRA
jgi:hypothetical protein